MNGGARLARVAGHGLLLAMASCGHRSASAEATPPSPARAAEPTLGASVLQHHHDRERDGRYTDPSFTRGAAARIHRDASFVATLAGPTYAQPLFLDGGPGGRDLLFTATERNEVTAFDGASGAVAWRRRLGTPVPLGALPCGNINPLGITGTPYLDASARTLYLDAMTTPDGGGTKRHLVFALSVDDGSTRSGWPAELSSSVHAGTLPFDPAVQNQRGALALLDGVVYVPFGGHWGDCGTYHGWVIGLPVAAPSLPRAWATEGQGGGIWAPGGIASDGQYLYVATGNTFGTAVWRDGEAILRLSPGPALTTLPANYFAPRDWQALDMRDADLGGSGPLLIDVPGARPSRLVVALGKDGKAYLLNVDDLGGIGGQLAVTAVSRTPIIGAAASYMTASSTYVVFRGTGVGCPDAVHGDLAAFRIVAASPPRISLAWCASQDGQGSPIVTTTDGRSDAVVWSVGAEGDERLHGFDGDSGDVLFAGGGPRDAMASVRRFQTPIVAKGRIFVAGDTQVYAFTTAPSSK